MATDFPIHTIWVYELWLYVSEGSILDLFLHLKGVFSIKKFSCSQFFLVTRFFSLIQDSYYTVWNMCYHTCKLSDTPRKLRGMNKPMTHA